MQDSIMRCVTIEEMLQQANAQEKRIELTNETNKTETKPISKVIKTKVIGTYEYPDAPEEDKSRYKKHEHTIVNSIPEDATNFFRKTPQY